jgi:hypothetical protein
MIAAALATGASASAAQALSPAARKKMKGLIKMTRYRCIGFAAALLLAVIAVPASASPASAADPVRDYAHELSAFGTGQCLQPEEGATWQGAAIVLETCDGSLAQRWVEEPRSGSVVHYRNGLSGLCLDARGGAADGTPIQQWTCNNISNENWEPEDVQTDDVPVLFSRVSGTRSHCLDIGPYVQIRRCNWSLAQLWWLPTVERG